MNSGKSRWKPVADKMAGGRRVFMRGHDRSWFKGGWQQALRFSVCYKFAAKMIGRGKKVLDIGCGEGLGTWILAKECGFAKGVDWDGEALAFASNNWKSAYADFGPCKILGGRREAWDAVVCFESAELIRLYKQESFFNFVKNSLASDGIAVLGAFSSKINHGASMASGSMLRMPSLFQLLVRNMRRHFRHVFIFSANDGTISAGLLRNAEQLIAVGCRMK